MLPFLHKLSATLFYILGSSVFLAYILFHNGILTGLSSFWLMFMDLPLLLAGLLYGGLSVYRSVRDDSSVSTILMISIGLPLFVIFIAVLVLNFWPSAS